MLREFTAGSGDEPYYETFHEYGPALVEVAYGRRDEPISCAEDRYDDGLLVSTTAVASGGGWHEAYRYDDRRPVEVLAWHAERRDGVLGPLRYRETVTAEHDEDGLVRLHRGRELVYERPPARFDLEQACRAVQAELVRAVPVAVAALPPDGPLACVALGYSLDRPLPATVHLGYGGWDRDDPDAWGPADLDGEVEPRLDQGLVRRVGQELFDAGAVGGRERARALLCAAAAELNRLDWNAIVPVTAGFVVYACDYEQADLERNRPECGITSRPAG